MIPETKTPETMKATKGNKELIRLTAEQEVQLSTLPKGMQQIAKTQMQLHGYYTCIWDGKKTFVTQ